MSIQEITRQDIMKMFREGVFHEHLSRSDCKEIFLGILKNGAEVNKAMMYDVLRRYSGADNLVIRHELESKSYEEIGQAVIARLIANTHFDIDGTKTLLIANQDVKIQAKIQPWRMLEVLRVDNGFPIVKLELDVVPYSEHELKEVIVSLYRQVIGALNKYRVKNK